MMEHRVGTPEEWQAERNEVLTQGDRRGALGHRAVGERRDGAPAAIPPPAISFESGAPALPKRESASR
jgi:hypothetical protein